MPIPPLLHQTWKTEHLPTWAVPLYQSWSKHHPTFEHWLWTDEDNRALVTEHLPTFLETYDALPLNIQRVDAVRYLILYLYGGIYVDLDFECYRPLDRLLTNYDLVLSYSGNAPVITNSIMMSAPGLPFWLRVLEHIKTAPAQHWWEPKSLYVLRSTGPLAVNPYAQALKTHPNVCLLPKKHFFPFSMFQRHKRFTHSTDSTTSEVFGAHHHMCTWTNDHKILFRLAGLCVCIIVTVIVHHLWKKKIHLK